MRGCIDRSTFPIGPFFLNLLLDVIAGGGDQSIGYVYACCMAVGLIFGAICDNQHFQRVVRAGVGTASMTAMVHIRCHAVHILAQGLQSCRAMYEP